MNKLRKILKPLSVLYGEVTNLRNKAYDKNIIQVTAFDFPVISVGNLSTGGTGKTPQVEYLIRLLQKDYRVAVLSRGYKRKSKGFIIAGKDATAEQIGDEPMQYFLKFPEIMVAVDANRINGIDQLRAQEPKPDVIILDDAFQHRSVKAGLNILLTTFDKPYSKDEVLPSGDLREKRSGAKRAEVIVLTKCPEHLSEKDQFEKAKELNPELYQTVFFSAITYDRDVLSEKDTININDLKDYKVLLVTGIAKTDPLVNFLISKGCAIKHLRFSDHHQFSNNDIKRISDEFSDLNEKRKIILTTEKDYVRTPEFSGLNVYYLPIQTKFISNQIDFDKIVLKYVRENTGNS